MNFQKAYSGQSLSGSGPIPVPQDTPQEKLHYLFYKRLIPFIQTTLFSEAFQGERRYVWVTVISTGQHSLLHVAPALETSEAYNCEDPDTENPMLIFGSLLLWPKILIEDMIFAHPSEHGAVPPQLAFAVMSVEEQLPQPTLEDLRQLVSKKTLALSTGGYNIELMTPPTGRESLSFNKSGFPIQFWTHDRRGDVLPTAIRLTRHELEQAELEAKEVIEQRLNILEKVKQQEDEVRRWEKVVKGKDEAMQRLNGQIGRLEKGRTGNESHEEAVRQITARVERCAEEREQCRAERDDVSNQVNEARNELVSLCQAHQQHLPRSYQYPTFQVAADFTDSQGRHIYKRFVAGGKIETEIDSDESTIRFLNDVHLPYHMGRLPDPEDNRNQQ